MKKSLPIGIDGFPKIINHDFYYVDKTMLIAELIKNFHEVTLFTRPRRFGKSLNMSMIKSFFEIGCDKALFENLEIAKCRELCERNMGIFPVIFLTLKDISSPNFDSAKNQLKTIIGIEAERFEFLLDSSKLSENDKDKYQALISLKNGNYNMSDETLENSIYTISQLLVKHFGQKTIILIDEYDVPLDKAFQNEYYDEMIFLIRNMFSKALKSNDNLHFAVLIGCLRISKESIFTGLNNLRTYSITDSKCDKYFGFTEREVYELLEYYNISCLMNTVKEWYNGYRFGKEAIYCPWDVLNYCDALLEDKEAEPENYWANTSGNAMVKHFIGKADRQARSEIERLIAGERIEKQINTELTYPELDSSIENLWSVLFTTGYLTQTGRTPERKYYLSIPNREIRELFISQIREWFREETSEDTGKLRQFCEAFTDGDSQIVENLLNEYLWNSISIRDTSDRENRKESFFHGLLLGLLQHESNWEILSNRESGIGYTDISILTPKGIGVIIELKYARDGNLEKSCEQALHQIETKDYDEILRREGMEKILKYGIACFKKKCKVLMKEKI